MNLTKILIGFITATIIVSAAHAASTVRISSPGTGATMRSGTARVATTDGAAISSNSAKASQNTARLSVSKFMGNNTKASGISSGGAAINNLDSNDAKISELESRIATLENYISENLSGEEATGTLSAMAPNTLMGNNTKSEAAPADLTRAQVTKILKGTDGDSLMVGNDKRVVMTVRGVYHMKGKYYVPTPKLPEPPELPQVLQ